MNANEYQKKLLNQDKQELLRENLTDVLKYYVLFSNLTKLAFFKYDYELNNFIYDFSVDKTQTFQEDIEPTIQYSNYTLIVEDEGNMYGMLSFDEAPGEHDILNDLFNKIKLIIKKQFELQKEFLLDDTSLPIYIITDEATSQFAKKLENNLEVLLNAHITIVNTIATISDSLKDNMKKSIIIYTVDNKDLLHLDEEYLNKLNEFLFVIGPSDYDTPLFCGRLNVHKYISKDNFIPDELKSFIIETKNEIQNKYIHNNKIISISGIAGGVGTTTIAMNTANLLAQRNQDKNILFIDLCDTKAISNLFLDKNPLPKKTIIDLISSNEYDITHNLENGLVRVRENFYAVNGIQKHIDSDVLEQDAFIGKFLDYISKMSEKFNFIIIDTGEADAKNLNTTIYDVANEAWILTEMSLPHISKLKTFFSLIKRAGLKNKVSFVLNRYDAINAISSSDITSILNTASEDHINFNLKIPNDYITLGQCWNYCELATDTQKNSSFVKTLEKILLEKRLISEEIKDKKIKSSFLSFLRKD